MELRSSGGRSKGNTLTIIWHVLLERCLTGRCGTNIAYEYVRDSDELWEFGPVGWWLLYSQTGVAQQVGAAGEPAKVDGSTEFAEVLEWLKTEIEAWQTGLGPAPP